MGFLTKLIGGAAGETAKGLMSGVGDLATKIRGAITGELPPDARAKLQELSIEADNLLTQGQMGINAIEAQHKSVFVAGWRPFIGWVCGLAMAWHFLLHPMIIWYMSIKLPDLELPPALDLSELYPVVLGILGLGAFRTYEKAKGTQGNH